MTERLFTISNKNTTVVVKNIRSQNKTSTKIDLMNHLPNSRYFSNMKMFYLYPK